MIYDLSVLPRNNIPHYDIIIIGAGTSGIVTLTRILERNPDLKVCILESGSFKPNPTVNRLDLFDSPEGTFNLENSSARCFGGKSNLWGGRIINLESKELDTWPINRVILDEYVNQALEILGVSEKNISAIQAKANAILENDTFGSLFSGRLVPSVAFFAAKTKVFGLSDLGAINLRTSANVDLYLHANVTNFSLYDSLNTVSEIKVHDTLGNFEKITYFSGDKVLLATGGVEVVKILNLSQSAKNVIGPSLGKNFSGHPRGIRGILKLRKPVSVGSPLVSKFQPSGFPLLEVGLRLISKNNGEVISRVVLNAVRGETHNAFFYKLRPKNAYMREYLNNSGVKEKGYIAGFASYFFAKVCKVFGIVGKTKFLYVSNYVGSSLNTSSNVSVNVSGNTYIDWEIDKIDKEGLINLHNEIKESLGSACEADFFDSISVDDWTLWGGSSHFMSATVMNNDEQLGVVDANCKVHGIENLWIVGPSVFPTPSHANPMLMIVALSLLVGDRLTADI